MAIFTAFQTLVIFRIQSVFRAFLPLRRTLICLYSRFWYAKGTLNFSRKKADQFLALFGIVSFVEYKEFPRVFFCIAQL